MKSFIKRAIPIGIPFGFVMGIIFAFDYGPQYGIIGGIGIGILFGGLISTFIQYQKKKFQADRPLLENEELIKAGSATHFKSKQSVGGWIYLTDKRIFFNSLAVNIQKHELSIPLHIIKEVKTWRVFAILPTGLQIKVIDGNSEFLAVEGRRNWVKEIREAKTKVGVRMMWKN